MTKLQLHGLEFSQRALSSQTAGLLVVFMVSKSSLGGLGPSALVELGLRLGSKGKHQDQA